MHVAAKYVFSQMKLSILQIFQLSLRQKIDSQPCSLTQTYPGLEGGYGQLKRSQQMSCPGSALLKVTRDEYQINDG